MPPVPRRAQAGRLALLEEARPLHRARTRGSINMSDPLGDFRSDPPDVLMEKMSHYPIGHRDRMILQAELDRRVAVKQIESAKAQVRGSWFQFAALVVATLALIVSVIALVRH